MAAVAGEQLTTLAFNTNWAHRAPRRDPARRGARRACARDLNRVFFTNGGSESVETAWKLTRQFHLANGEPERTKAIARDIAYHGVTLGALSFTGVPGMKAPFGTPAIETHHVSNTNRFRAPDGDDEAAFCARLLAEVEQTILDAGPETVALIIAEPVQNAGGCLVPPAGLLAGPARDRRPLRRRSLCADEVITGFGRLGELFASTRFGVVPDLITTAKGITSAYAPMGAVFVSDRVAAPLYAERPALLHGITFGGPSRRRPRSRCRPSRSSSATACWRTCGRWSPTSSERLQALRELPIVGDVRGAGFFWAVELVSDDENTPFDADQRERLLRGFMPGRLLEAGLIARADDRGDSVLQVAPPLISDQTVLDELVEKMGEVLADAGTFMARDA